MKGKCTRTTTIKHAIALKVLFLSVFSKYIHFMAILLLVYSTDCDDTFTREYNFKRCFIWFRNTSTHKLPHSFYTVTTLQSNLINKLHVHSSNVQTQPNHISSSSEANHAPPHFFSYIPFILANACLSPSETLRQWRKDFLQQYSMDRLQPHSSSDSYFTLHCNGRRDVLPSQNFASSMQCNIYHYSQYLTRSSKLHWTES